jgi:hypothetical protein
LEVKLVPTLGICFLIGMSCCGRSLPEVIILKR